MSLRDHRSPGAYLAIQEKREGNGQSSASRELPPGDRGVDECLCR